MLPGNSPGEKAPGVWLASFTLPSAVHEGVWEKGHIGLAESARGALRCGQRREHRHRQREARGIAIAG